jgi:hypothetical protein
MMQEQFSGWLKSLCFRGFRLPAFQRVTRQQLTKRQAPNTGKDARQSRKKNLIVTYNGKRGPNAHKRYLLKRHKVKVSHTESAIKFEIKICHFKRFGSR